MKTKTWLALLALVLALCLWLSLWLLTGPEARQVEVWSDGELLYVLELRTDQELTVTTDRGSNTITVRGGAVAVTAADCPDHYCMDRGFCSGGAQIVCLPNRLVLKFIGQQQIDGVAG